MRHPCPSRFLKTASFVIAFGILVFGISTSEKNANLFSKIEPNLSEASVAAAAGNSIPTTLGNCQQNKNIGILSVLLPEQSLFAMVNNLDAILTGAASFDTAAMNALTAAVAKNRIEAKILESGEKYEFVVKDGQLDFWKCVLQKNQLFASVSETREVEFFSETAAFKSQIEKFGYAAGNVREVELFLNFAELPAGHRIFETTVLAEGKIFFKIFEVDLLEGTSYNDLRKDLRSRVGITNLRPAVFGADSFYWMWGAENRMAASVFPIEGKVFGVSYQTAHFHHIRRVIDLLREEFDLLAEKVELVKNLGDGEFENLTISKFEKLDLKSLDSKIVEALKQFENPDNILVENLSSNILKITPIKIVRKVETKSVEKFDEFTPIEISKEALESLENWSEDLPLDL